MDNNFEWCVLIALFKATQEQQSMLIGETQREAKMIFNRWSKDGNKLLKIVENLSDEETLENLTKTIEDEIHRLRKLNKSINLR
jgi:hypothetical protein